MVIRRVFVGFTGCVKGGMEERSRVRWDPRREQAGDPVGERRGEANGDVWFCDIVIVFV